MPPEPRFGQRRICYNNVAKHLQNAYNSNLLYPGLPNRWADQDWRRLIGMLAGFGFNAFESWLVPRLFGRAGIDADFGRQFVRQMSATIDHAHTRGLQVVPLAGLATVGMDWRTRCPLSAWTVSATSPGWSRENRTMVPALNGLG